MMMDDMENMGFKFDFEHLSYRIGPLKHPDVRQ